MHHPGSAHHSSTQVAQVEHLAHNIHQKVATSTVEVHRRAKTRYTDARILCVPVNGVGPMSSVSDSRTCSVGSVPFVKVPVVAYRFHVNPSLRSIQRVRVSASCSAISSAAFYSILSRTVAHMFIIGFRRLRAIHEGMSAQCPPIGPDHLFLPTVLVITHGTTSIRSRGGDTILLLLNISQSCSLESSYAGMTPFAQSMSPRSFSDAA